MTIRDKKIVCLGGGIGTVNLIKGLQTHTKNISVVVSVADDGGSAGRIRRLYNIPPPGDIVSCISALSQNKNELYPKMLTYRFPGDRYGKDHSLPGHKLGNLMMAAAVDLTGSLQDAIELMKDIFDVSHNIYASTPDTLSLSALTTDGIEVQGEENIDLGKYKGKRVLEKVWITPRDPAPSRGVLEAIADADVIIAGPGDLYTTILPVLIIPKIKQAILESSACKMFIVNVANKPFETKGYTVSCFVQAITTHLGTFPFNKTVVNNNFSLPIPPEFKYTYVRPDEGLKIPGATELIAGDLINETFPLYHDSVKLASLVSKNI